MSRNALHAPPQSVTTTELLQWVFDRLNDHDAVSVRQLWTDETVEYFPDRTCVGPAEIQQWFEEKFAALDGFRLAVVKITAAGDDAFVHWRMSGRHIGPLLGIAATGRTISVEGLDHFVLEAGLVRSNTVVFDQLALARQLGLMPADGSLPERVLKAAFNAKTHAVDTTIGRFR